MILYRAIKHSHPHHNPLREEKWANDHHQPKPVLIAELGRMKSVYHGEHKQVFPSMHEEKQQRPRLWLREILFDGLSRWDSHLGQEQTERRQSSQQGSLFEPQHGFGCFPIEVSRGLWQSTSVTGIESPWYLLGRHGIWSVFIRVAWWKNSWYASIVWFQGCTFNYQPISKEWIRQHIQSSTYNRVSNNTFFHQKYTWINAPWTKVHFLTHFHWYTLLW